VLKLQQKEGIARTAAGSTHGETFHVAGEERSNLEIAQFIAKTLGKKLDYEVVDVHVDRPGHDLRYSLSDEKIKSKDGRPRFLLKNRCAGVLNGLCGRKM